ncbi:hypothetical protein L1049_026975 [Liquidambar formosana]|uniref:Zinc finger PHD-type domain-containing protein n=1 Tax=Liquidambar formosana TaxID=63359 RepID=A0AAP0NGG9_LIQFO
MVTICQKCGDKGYSVALIYCDKCQVSAEHRYCLDILPETFDEYVTWFCEDCVPKVAEPTLEKACSIPLRKSGRFKVKAVHVTQSRTIVKKNKRTRLSVKRKNITGPVTKTKVPRCESSPLLQPCKAHSSEDREKDQKLGKRRKLKLRYRGKPDDEVEYSKFNTFQIASGSLLNISENEPSLQPCEDNSSENCEKDQKLGKQRKSILRYRDKPEDEAESTKFDTFQRASGNPSNISANDPSLQPCEDHSSENCETDQKLGKQRKSILRYRGNFDDEAESSKFNTSQKASGDPSNISGHDNYVHAQPIIDPVWRGIFSICKENFGAIDGLVAHLSSKACLKVCEEARLLPELLCLDMLPRSDVWPKSFGRSGPGDDHIGLYFFPENERDERVFDNLVEYMIDQDLAMRAVAENAELLVFTSMQLPIEYWSEPTRLYVKKKIFFSYCMCKINLMFYL